jgi:dynein heavy chain 1
VNNLALRATQMYPFAICLIEALRTNDMLNERVDAQPSTALLLAGVRREVQTVIQEGIGITWDGYKTEAYVKRLSAVITRYQEQCDELMLIQANIDVQLAALDSCVYAEPEFASILKNIQEAVDKLSLSSYSNLSVWTERLDQSIEAKLSRRLHAAVRAWTKAVLTGTGGVDGKVNAEDLDSTYNATDAAKNKLGGEPNIAVQLFLSFCLKQQLFAATVHGDSFTKSSDVSGAVDRAGATDIVRANVQLAGNCHVATAHQFHAFLCIVRQGRRQQTRGDLSVRVARVRIFYEYVCSNLLAHLPDGTVSLEAAYSAVENVINQVQTYVEVWLRYQALWDLQADTLYERLGSELTKWRDTLLEIRCVYFFVSLLVNRDLCAENRVPLLTRPIRRNS